MQSISLCLFWSTEKAPRLQNLLKFRAFFRKGPSGCPADAKCKPSGLDWLKSACFAKSISWTSEFLNYAAMMSASTKHALLCNASSTSPTGNHEAHIASANLKAFQPTNAKSFPTNWALWCWAPWLIHLLGPTRNIFSAQWLWPLHFSHFSYTPCWGVKMGKSPWRFPHRFFWVLSQALTGDLFWPKGPLCWYLTGFCTHSHLVLSIHLSFKMPYISAIHS